MPQNHIYINPIRKLLWGNCKCNIAWDYLKILVQKDVYKRQPLHLLISLSVCRFLKIIDNDESWTVWWQDDSGLSLFFVPPLYHSNPILLLYPLATTDTTSSETKRSYSVSSFSDFQHSIKSNKSVQKEEQPPSQQHLRKRCRTCYNSHNKILKSNWIIIRFPSTKTKIINENKNEIPSQVLLTVSSY